MGMFMKCSPCSLFSQQLLEDDKALKGIDIVIKYDNFLSNYCNLQSASNQEYLTSRETNEAAPTCGTTFCGHILFSWNILHFAMLLET